MGTHRKWSRNGNSEKFFKSWDQINFLFAFHLTYISILDAISLLCKSSFSSHHQNCCPYHLCTLNRLINSLFSAFAKYSHEQDFVGQMIMAPLYYQKNSTLFMLLLRACQETPGTEGITLLALPVSGGDSKSQTGEKLASVACYSLVNQT